MAHIRAKQDRSVVIAGALSLGLLLLGVGFPVTKALAQASSSPVLVDRIVAIVDEEAILQSDVDREMELYRMEKEYAGEKVGEITPELRKELLERLIESKLIIAAAKQADMSVDEAAIEDSVEGKIDQFIEHFGSMENLEKELFRSGMTLGDYKVRMSNQLRDQQFLRLVIGRFIRPDIEVMDNEVRDFYLAHLDEMPAEPDSLTIANIMIPVQPSEEVRQNIQSQVQVIQSALDSGRPFPEVAGEYSRGPNARRGGTVGVVAPGDLFDPVLDEVVFQAAIGVVSQPVISSRGVHLLRVDGVQADGRRAISQIFLPIEVTQADIQKSEEEIKAARARIMSGESFSQVAMEVSADPVSAPKGGLLGTFRLEDLSTQFQEVLKDARQWDITEPLMTPSGFYIFQVQSRIAGHMFTFEELQGQLRQAVENEKIEGALAAYTAGLRTRFFIDMKN